MKLLLDGLSEIAAGLKYHPVWVALAKENIGDQHRRTTLGPLWLVLNYFLFAGAFVVIFGPSSEVEYYPAYAATGLFVWLIVSEAVSTGVSLFRHEESYIKGTTLPLFVYVMRLTMQTMIRAVYAGVAWVFLLTVLHQPTLLEWGMAALGLSIIFVTIPAAVAIFALLGAFFPDLDFVVANLVRVGMFLTPVFWVHGSEGGIRSLLHDLNPFTYFISVVRDPVVNGSFPVGSYTVCVLISLLLWMGAIVLLGALRKKVIFVL